MIFVESGGGSVRACAELVEARSATAPKIVLLNQVYQAHLRHQRSISTKALQRARA
jgi:hypothetical protein